MKWILVAKQTANPDDTAPLARSCHPACMVCGERNKSGLGLRFEPQADGSVAAHFACAPDYQGYPGRLHGGVVSMLLDAAMTNCLFARGIQAVTGRLNVRFRHPVKLGANAVIHAWLIENHAPLYLLKAELAQEGRVCALADAKFFQEDAMEENV